jgi:hypothetical protein
VANRYVVRRASSGAEQGINEQVPRFDIEHDCHPLPVPGTAFEINVRAM